MTNTEKPPAIQEQEDLAEVYRFYAEGKRITDPDLMRRTGSHPRPPARPSLSETACWTSPSFGFGHCVMATSNFNVTCSSRS